MAVPRTSFRTQEDPELKDLVVSLHFYKKKKDTFLNDAFFGVKLETLQL